MWKNKLKIAIIEKNIDDIETLLDEMPILNNIEEMQEVVYLFKEASLLVDALKNKTIISMNTIEKNLLFLHATQNTPISKIDIKS